MRRKNKTKHLIVKHTLLSALSTILLAGCAATTEEDSKGTANNPALAPQPETVVGAFELKRDPIDLLTGEALDANGHVPPRTNDQLTPSYALLPTERLRQAIIESRNYAFVAVKSPNQARGFYQAHGDETEFQLPQTVTGMVFPCLDGAARPT